MSNQSSRSLLKAENWSGSAPLQVRNVDEHVDIGSLLPACSGLHPQTEAGMGARGRYQDTHACHRDSSDVLALQNGTKLPWIWSESGKYAQEVPFGGDLWGPPGAQPTGVTQMCH